MKIRLAIASLALALALSSDPIQASTETILFQVTVLYDPNGDGIQEGVGLGTVVNARELSKMQGQIQITDQFSSAFFQLNPGLHRITAFPKSTRFLFEWACNETVFVSDTTDILILECEERFFMRLPWMKGH